MPRSQYWIRNVKTVSTFPPKGLFPKDNEGGRIILAG